VITLIVAGLLFYAMSSVGAGYVMGLIGADADRSFTTFLAIALGPVGLVFAIGHLAHQRGEHRRELSAARHKAELAQIEAASRSSMTSRL
jgi:hypothetical protein